MAQPGQVFMLKRRDANGTPVWAYRYRVDGRARGGRRSEVPAADATKRGSSGYRILAARSLRRHTASGANRAQRADERGMANGAVSARGKALQVGVATAGRETTSGRRAGTPGCGNQRLRPAACGDSRAGFVRDEKEAGGRSRPSRQHNTLICSTFSGELRERRDSNPRPPA